jgi:hypothetical protein
MDEIRGQHQRKINRRDFAKLASVIVAAGALTGGYLFGRYYDLFNHPPEANFTYMVSDNMPNPTLDLRTRTRTLRYIAANSGEEILFYNATTHPDKDSLTCVLFMDDQPVASTVRVFEGDEAPLIYSTKLPAAEHKARLEVSERERIVTLVDTSRDPDAEWPPPIRELFGMAPDDNYTWFLDGKTVGTTSRYSERLSVGQHAALLKVSDGTKESSKEQTIMVPESLQSSPELPIHVDPENVARYPEKRLRIPVKGISYVVGMKAWDMPAVSDDEMAESLAVIKELGCNGIRIAGDYEERIIKCAKLALDSFDTIELSPYSREWVFDDARERIGRLARDAEVLRGQSEISRIVLSVGNELAYEIQGIVPGSSYDERDKTIGKFGLTDDQVDTLNGFIRSLTDEASQYFKGELTYDSSVVEGKLLDWNNIGVHVLSPHRYLDREWSTETEYVDGIDWFIRKAHGKDVFISEFGYFTIEDAIRWGALGYEIATDPKVEYSQEAQASALTKNIELLNQTPLKGIYLWNFMQRNRDDRKSPGIIRWSENGMWTRKLSFYLYQSWRI